MQQYLISKQNILSSYFEMIKSVNRFDTMERTQNENGLFLDTITKHSRLF